jgi:predicted pyridoxine 5'-phosphate oxidase superfamily flavin-nucleotide-binding protein
MFFLATADALGKPDCSYKGGLPGFVRIVDERTLAFPDYNGNGMYRSLGNVLLNRSVALLFIDFERPQRLRILGEATLHDTDPLLAEFAGAQMIVRVRATRIFPNCPRYIHEMRLVKHSVYVPTQHHTPPVPVWRPVRRISRSAAAIRANTASQPENACADPGTAKPFVPHFPRCCATSKGVAGSKAAFPDYNGNGI